MSAGRGCLVVAVAGCVLVSGCGGGSGKATATTPAFTPGASPTSAATPALTTVAATAVVTPSTVVSSAVPPVTTTAAPTSAPTSVPTTAPTRFKALVKDPRLVFVQPAGLAGAPAAAVDALHDFYLHLTAAFATKNIHYPGLYAHMDATMQGVVASEIASLNGPGTGVVKVTVSAALAGKTTVVVTDCFDQTQAFGKDKNGKPIIVHNAADHIHESWIFHKPTGVWKALSESGRDGC